MKAEARVIANWQPVSYEHDTIACGLISVLASHGFLSTSIPQTGGPETGGATGWHRDNKGEAGLLAVWSSVKPTRVRFSDGHELIAVDGDVIVFKNEVVKHRAPPGIKKKDGRWFARTFVTEIIDHDY